MDLVDMSSYSRASNGHYWILTAVEILSRYAFAIPVYSKDTENMTKAMVTPPVKMTISVSTTYVLSFQAKICLKVLIQKIFICFVQDHLKPFNEVG